MPIQKPIRGQVAFSVGGQGFTLSYSVNALCALEEATGKPVQEIGAALASSDIRTSTVRAVFHAGLHDHHPEVSLEEAGYLMGELGVEPAAVLISASYLAAFPAPGVETTTARPRREAGTGSRSSRRGAKRA